MGSDGKYLRVRFQVRIALELNPITESLGAIMLKIDWIVGSLDSNHMGSKGFGFCYTVIAFTFPQT